VSLVPGGRLGPYEIVAPLGAGGMGEVYKARDTRLDRTVAIKVLPAGLAADPMRQARFEREAHVISALQHPRICTLYDVGEENRRAYLVMEHLVGETLAERLKKGPLPLARGLEIASQVAEGLAAAHKECIVHRDLKPANVMLTKTGVKLLDFGLASLTRPAERSHEDLLSAPTRSEALTGIGTILGTVPYMAPEQLEGKPADARSDIFSFGAVLYEMLSGRRAFEADSQAGVIAAILAHDPPPVSSMQPVTPPALDRIVGRCLAKDPDNRWQSAADLAGQLEGLAEELRRPGSGTAISEAPAVSRRRTAAWLGLGALAIAVLGAGAYLVGRRSAARPVPDFHRLTFRQGDVASARFTADGQSAIYTASWDSNPPETFTARVDGVDSEPRDALKGFLAAAISSRNEIAVLRGGRLSTAPLTGGAPREVAESVESADWAPDASRLAVTRFHEGWLVEYPIGTVIHRSPSPTVVAGEVRVSPRGDFLAFREHQSSHGRVVVVDTTGRKVAESSFIDGVFPPSWSPDGKEVWFSAATPAGTDTVRALDLSGHERTVQRSPGLVLCDVSRDGRVLLTRGEPALSIFGRGPGATVDRNLTYYGHSFLDDLSPDGRTIVFTEGGESDPANGWSVFVRPIDGSPPQAIARGRYAYGRLAPNGKWVAASTFPGLGRGSRGEGWKTAIALVPTGAGQERLIPASVGAAVVAWLPDSSAFLFRSEERIWLAPLDGPPRAITPEGWGTEGAVLAPDGRHFLCSHGQPDGTWIYLCAIDAPVSTSLPRVLDSSKWYPVGWTADGKQVRVLSLPATPPLRLFLLDPATGVARPWREIAGHVDRVGLGIWPGVWHPCFSADGESYAYTVWRKLTTLYVADGIQ
jgi:Tol biopolymer transport system component